jgi:hypothetical protein
MKTITATVLGNEYVFRTNNGGDNLFIGASENKQISCESGYDSLKRIKKAIRQYLNSRFMFQAINGDIKLPRIKYSYTKYQEFQK